MPMYTQYCPSCDDTKVLRSKIAERDEQVCAADGEKLERQIDKPGLVYNPTASTTGMFK